MKIPKDEGTLTRLLDDVVRELILHQNNGNEEVWANLDKLQKYQIKQGVLPIVACTINALEGLPEPADTCTACGGTEDRHYYECAEHPWTEQLD